jgi:hypothetical protein
VSIAPVQGGTNSATSSTSVTFTAGVAPTQGDLLVAYVGSSQTTTAATGWNKLTTATSGSTNGAIFWKVAGASESTSQTVATCASATWNEVWEEYSGVVTSSPVDVENGAGVSASSTPVLTPSVTPTASVERLAFCGGKAGLNTTWSSLLVGGVTANDRGHISQCGSWDLVVASTSGSYQGSATPSVTSPNEHAGIALFIAAVTAPAGSESGTVTEQTPVGTGLGTAEAGAVAEQPAATGLSNADATALAESVANALATSQAAVVTDTAAIALAAQESAVFAEAASIAVARSDSAVLSDLAAIAVAAADAITAGDSGAAISVPVTGSQAVILSDAASVAVAATGQDALSLGELASIASSSVAVAASDAAAFAEAMSTALAASDAATVVDTARIATVAQESAVFAEAARIALARNDTVVLSDLASIAVAAADAIAAGDSAVVNVPIAGSQAVTLSESANIAVASSVSAAADTVTLAELVTIVSAASAAEPVAFGEAVRIAFGATETISEIEGGWERRVVGYGGRPFWSWALNKLYYDRRDANGFFKIWRSDPDGSNEEALMPGVDLGWTAAGMAPGAHQRHVGGPSVSPDGRYMLFTVERYVPSNSTSVSEDPLQHLGGQPGRGTFNDVWIAGADGSNPRLLWPYTAIGTMQPYFSDDGLTVCWSHMTSGAGTYGTFVAKWAPFDPVTGTLGAVSTVDADTANTSVAHFNETHGIKNGRLYLSCNPLLGQSQSYMDVATINLDGTGLTRVTQTSGTGAEPSQYDEHLFPNQAGTKVAWMSSRNRGLLGGTEVWVADASGANPSQLSFFNTVGHAHYIAPVNGSATVTASRMCWSADGSEIIVTALNSPENALSGSQGPLCRMTLVAVAIGPRPTEPVAVGESAVVVPTAGPPVPIAPPAESAVVTEAAQIAAAVDVLAGTTVYEFSPQAGTAVANQVISIGIFGQAVFGQSVFGGPAGSPGSVFGDAVYGVTLFGTLPTPVPAGPGPDGGGASSSPAPSPGLAARVN